MKALRFARAVLAELASLVVDDAVTFFGAVAGLVLTWLLAHELGAARAADGFVLLAAVWLALAVSLRRGS